MPGSGDCVYRLAQPRLSLLSISLAASWAFSFQPVLPHVRRPLLHLVLSLKTQSSSPIQLSQGSGTDGSQFIYLHTVQFLCGRFLRNCTGAVGFFATTIYI